ncbi:MAG: hypothetical protein ABIG66_03720 [Candidatus Kerfeldbacteria bacterium]
MVVPIFERKPKKKDLREYSQHVPEWAEKRREEAAWLLEFRRTARELEATDPEAAEEYRRMYLPPQKVLEKFYSDVEKDYKELPLSKEEIDEQFTTENLSELSLDEYVELLRKVPPRFVTHITRQGIRDNISHHTGGYGEFNRGFEGVMENGSVRSILEQYLLDGVTKDTVREVIEKILEVKKYHKTRGAAASRVVDFLTTSEVASASSEFADQKAVHVALDTVADAYYGGERNNEIFFVYPVAYIAANYSIGSQKFNIPERFGPNEVIESSQYNDFWLLSKEKKSGDLPVDSAITFLPENTPVDPETGSRYMVDADGQPVPNTDQLEALKRLIQAPETKALWGGMGSAINDLYSNSRAVLDSKQNLSEMIERYGSDSYSTEDAETALKEAELSLREAQSAVDPLLKLAEKHGVTDPRFRDAVMDTRSPAFNALNDFFNQTLHDVPFSTHGEFDDFHFANVMRGLGMTNKLAEKTVTSREYWESYFDRTGKRPSKIIYYEQQTPNEAFDAFRERAGLIEDGLHREVDLKEMYKENDVGQEGIHQTLERERELFIQYADEILDELYSEEIKSKK